MKIAHLLMLPALIFACYGTTHAQMPGYPMPGGAAYPGQQMNFGDPMGGGGGAPMAMGPGAPMMGDPMQGMPAHPEALSGADGGFNGEDCYGSCGPGTVSAACRYGYVQIDALYLTREHGYNVNILNSSTAPGTSLINGAKLNYDFEVLPRLTAGYVLANGVAIEGLYFYKDDFSTRVGVGSTGNIDMVAFGNPAVVFGAGSSFNNANWGSVTAATQIQNGEVNLVETERFFNFLAGFRWMELSERTIVGTQGVNGTGFLDLKTYNRLMGGQAGMRMAHSWGLFGLQAQGKAGMYYNDAKGVTTVNGSGNFTRNVDGQNESFIGEIELMATIRTLSSWQYRFGVNAMWINEVALATDQIRGTANTGAALNAKSDLFVWGPFAGAEFRW